MFVLVIILMPFIAFAGDAKDAITQVTTPGPANVFVHVHNTNQQSQQVNNQPYFYNYLIKIKNLMLPQSLRDVKLEDLPQKMREQFTVNMLSIKEFAKEYAKEHKYRLLLFSAFGTYAAVWVRLFYYIHYIFQSTGWGTWKENLSIDVLYAIPKQELGKELLFAVQQKYQKAETLNDFFLPLISFLRDADDELLMLNNFVAFYDLLHKAHVDTIFPLQEIILTKARQRLQRLLYLKEVFLYWVTDYKIAVSTPARRL